MWRKLQKLYRRVVARFDFKERKKKEQWQVFVKANSARIKFLPTRNGKKVVPAIWNPRTEEWQWVTRQTRRRAQNIVRRMA